MIVAANTNQIAAAKSALALVCSLISCLTIPKTIKSMIIATRETMNAKRAMKAANRKPRWSEHRAMRKDRKAIPHAMGWRMKALVTFARELLT